MRNHIFCLYIVTSIHQIAVVTVNSWKTSVYNMFVYDDIQISKIEALLLCVLDKVDSQI